MIIVQGSHTYRDTHFPEFEVGYDLDGVLLPDFDYLGLNKGTHDVSEAELSRVRCHLHPLFQPKGVYAIVTSRPSYDFAETRWWIENHLEVQPAGIFIAGRDLPLLSSDSARYKAGIMQKYNIHNFVESCEEIAAGMRSILQGKWINGVRPIVLTSGKMIEHGHEILRANNLKA